MNQFLEDLQEEYEIFCEENEEYKALPLKEKEEIPVAISEPQEIIPADAIQEVTVKKGLFRKKKKIIINM